MDNNCNNLTMNPHRKILGKNCFPSWEGLWEPKIEGIFIQYTDNVLK